MDDQHLEHTQQIDVLIRMFLQDHCHQHQLPGVFGIVFAARRIQQRCPTNDQLQLFDFKNELELLPQSGIRHETREFVFRQVERLKRQCVGHWQSSRSVGRNNQMPGYYWLAAD